MFDTNSWITSHGNAAKYRQILAKCKCRLEYRDEVSADALEAGGDGFKQHIRRGMAHVIGEALMPKISYSVTDNLERRTKSVKAAVYAFTERELLDFIKDIHDVDK